MEIKKNIYEKLFEVKKAGIKLQRDTKAFNYKYATLDQIQTKLNPFFEENKLLVTHRIFENQVLTSIINIEEPQEQIESAIEMTEGTKAQDKGSEITYYRRYNLLSLLDLEVEDDDGKKAQYSGVKKQETDDKPWFSDKNLADLEKNINKFATADEAVKAARVKYKISREFETKIRNLFY